MPAPVRRPLLGFFGGLLLLGGLGLGWFALRLRNPRGRLRGGGLPQALVPRSTKGTSRTNATGSP